MKKLPVPFESQKGKTANRFLNDCLPGCVVMVAKYKVPALNVTVDEVAAKTSLKTKDKGILPSEGIILLGSYKIPSYAQHSLTLEHLRREIDMDRPVILLVNYKYFSGVAFGHYVVLVGYDDFGFYVHDPYDMGEYHWMSVDTFEKAITDVSKFSFYSRQGILLK